MSDTEADTFATDVAELFMVRVKRFAAWVETEWTLTHEEAIRDNLNLSAEQVDGWNRACQSMVGAAQIWLDDIE